MVDRRRFLFGAGAAILAAPTLSTLTLPDVSAVNPFDFLGGAKLYPIDRTLDRMLEPASGGNRFVAVAQTTPDIIEVDSRRVFSSTRALRNIFDRLNIDWDLKEGVCYCEAEQCEPQFREHEQDLRQRFNAFAGVKRSPVEEDVAYLVGADSTTEPTTAAAATQYGGYKAIGLSGKDPGLVDIASDLINEQYEVSPQEVARSFAVVGREPYYRRGVHVGTRYETPVSSFIHVERSAAAPLGVLQVRNKLLKDGKVYTAGLYA